MAAYTLHVDANAQAGDRDALDGAIVLRDGFSWSAFVLQPVWFLWHHLWLPALAVILIMVVLAVICGALNVSGGAFVLAELMLAFFIALEANNIRGWMLERRGAPAVDTVVADDRDSAEARLLARWLDRRETQAPFHPPAPRRPSASATSVVGLFPEPEGGR